jgi:hypothetical protein
MNIRLIFKRIAHHARNSGYHQLAGYVDGRPHCKGLLYRIARRLPERRIAEIEGFNSVWYRREALWVEPELLHRVFVGWWLRDHATLRAAILKVHEREPGVRRIVTFAHLFEKYDGLPTTELSAGIADEERRDGSPCCTTGPSLGSRCRRCTPESSARTVPGDALGDANEAGA